MTGVLAKYKFQNIALLGLLMLNTISYAASDTLAALERQLKTIDDADAALLAIQGYAGHVAAWEPLARGRYSLLRANQLEKAKRLDEAFSSYTIAIEILEALPPSAELVESYIERSYVRYIKTNDPYAYCPDRRTALQYARKMTAAEPRIKALTAVAFCFGESDQFSQGLILLEEALEIAEGESLPVNRRAMIYNVTATLYRNNLIYDRAYEYLAEALALWTTVDDRQDMFNMLHGMVSAALSMGAWELADENVARLFELADSSPDFKDFRFFAYFNAGLSALKQQRLEAAVQALENALKLQNSTDEQHFIRLSRGLLATALMRGGDLDRAAVEAKVYLSMLPDSENAGRYAFVSRAIVALEKGQGEMAMQAMFALLDRAEERRIQFTENATLASSIGHDARVAAFENQLMEQQLDIQRLELVGERDRQKISELTLVIVGLIAITLLAIVVVLYRSRRRFEIRSQTDFLTGIANRSFILGRGQLLAAKALRLAGPFSVAMLDIDHFKAINDSHGHSIGDEVIKAVADEVNARLDENELIGRIGGEEFLIIFPGLSHKHALSKAEQLRLGISEKEFRFGDVQLKLTASLGVASMPEHGESIPALSNAADEALYRAKALGRNRTESAQCADTDELIIAACD